MRIVFMGSPDFAVPTLEKLIESAHDVVGVFSQPPRPAGRGMKEQKTPVHRVAEAYHIPVFTPKRIDDTAFAELQTLQPDLIVVAAYGLILRKRVLDLAPCLNIHPSALPRWRGAAPLNWTILAGDKNTEICIMHMEEALDTGPVYKRIPIELEDNETAGSLHNKAAQIGAKGLIEVVNNWADFKNKASPQSNEGVTYAHKIEKDDRLTDFSKPAEEVLNHIRGLSPFPCATGKMEGVNYKFLMAEHGPNDAHGNLRGGARAGSVLAANPAEGLVVACGKGSIRLSRLQKEGKAAMDDIAFLRGNNLPEGAAFESK